MALSEEQYRVQRARQEKAVVDLRVGGSLLHAVARAYYLVYITASYVGSRHGLEVTHSRGTETIDRDDFTHNAIPDVIQALYSGQKRGKVSPGNSPGIGSGHFTDRDAGKKADLLQRDRKDADYGPTKVLEPYSESEADERIDWANWLIKDLETLL